MEKPTETVYFPKIGTRIYILIDYPFTHDYLISEILGMFRVIENRPDSRIFLVPINYLR